MPLKGRMRENICNINKKLKIEQNLFDFFFDLVKEGIPVT